MPRDLAREIQNYTCVGTPCYLKVARNMGGLLITES